MEPHQVLASMFVNGRKEGLAFSALPDAPILPVKAPGWMRQQMARVRSAVRRGPSMPVSVVRYGLAHCDPSAR